MMSAVRPPSAVSTLTIKCDASLTGWTERRDRGEERGKRVVEIWERGVVDDFVYVAENGLIFSMKTSFRAVHIVRTKEGGERG